jgi:hypothetical protein
MPSSMPGRRHLAIAAAILAVGWGVAIALYLSGSDDSSLPFELTSDSRQYTNQVERLGGKSAVVYGQVLDAVRAWTNGWRLGMTIAVISTVVALVYLWIAPAADQRPPRR